ncbi:ATP-NAD kinase family protein [Pleionea sp. CnH1-48]|uniref:ATP-NAD kinase family protein n=1 Tax=Pleionea sp. CnH1-48 TaxID=2954494 RepID=UPI002097EC21|nr:ATP-NAD kinase family protein [Pleionea sp. CnH1-48]MCO7223638.1 ATP-NAD kinase family protein [Pleionea sp. CnH1-48]
MFKLGLVVNPFAGIGGSVALKGSDGEDIRALALEKGAQPLAPTRSQAALAMIEATHRNKLQILTASGAMGEDSVVAAGMTPVVVAEYAQPSQAEDTQDLIRCFEQQGVDVILFAGGDGTARDILSTLDTDIPVLGIPAGCKIHSGVYAVTPKAAGMVINQLIEGELLSLREASVMDIDEAAFREGRVKARNFGSMIIPDALKYVQATKQGGVEVEELVLQDIAADVIENMEPDICYAIGSGSTCAALMEELGLENTLLGIDVVKDNQLIASDVDAIYLSNLCEQETVEAVITIIGGQGHIIGRGNQQFSPEVIQKIGWEHFHVIATKQKVQALEGKPLIVDSGVAELDDALSGLKKVITGYHDSVIYRVGIDYDA